VIRKLLDKEHQVRPMVMIQGETLPLRSWLDHVLTKTHEAQSRPLPEAFSITAHSEHSIAIYATTIEQSSNAPSEIIPNDIIDAYLADSDFQFLKYAPIHHEISQILI
jgi:hypothetical protein